MAQVFCKTEGLFFCLSCDQSWHTRDQLDALKERLKTHSLEQMIMQESSQSIQDDELEQEEDRQTKLKNHQRFQLEDYQSLVSNLQRSEDQYGHCKAHGKRVFEFYCFDCSEALCAMCLIESSERHSEHQIQELQKAY